MFYSKKSLGQNFLKDQNIIKKIINLKNIKNKDIVEIGPGKGAITEEILKHHPNSLTIIEKDNYLLKKLNEKYKNYNSIRFYNNDILKINLEKIIKKNSIIFGNLPYNVSSQILVKLIKFTKWPPKFTDLILMFQKEVAEKIIGKSYGRLSIIANYRLKYLNKFDVSPNCFFPKPKITSTVIHLVPIRKLKYKINDIKNLEYITNIFFSGRRKMINKKIKKVFNLDQIKKFKNLDFKDRPADLKKEFYYQATEFYESG
jgi:16S rRNA (adenine1518-N6/adenine1519-N6)-dimethyltransferase